MGRFDALETVLNCTHFSDALLFSTTGKLSRELVTLRNQRNSEKTDFLNVGAMGHVSQIAFGAACALPDQNIVCLDGDGSAIMHLGGLAVLASQKPQNLIYLLFNNGAHDSVGGQPTAASQLDFSQISLGMGFQYYERVTNIEAFTKVLDKVPNTPRPCFIEVVIRSGSIDGLIRPSTTPAERMNHFVEQIRGA